MPAVPSSMAVDKYAVLNSLCRRAVEEANNYALVRIAPSMLNVTEGRQLDCWTCRRLWLW